MSVRRYQSYFDPATLFNRLADAIHPGQQQQQQQQIAPVANDDHENSAYESASEVSEAPIRFIIIRHGERVDVVYGAGWTKRAFTPTGQYYQFDSNMPPSLPPRKNLYDYDVDTPLTAKGLSQSWNVGNVLQRYNLQVDACYSSPAFRSIQTADRILEGMGRKGIIPLRLELGLFECTSWYARSPIHFMSDAELINGGYHIDTRYPSQTANLLPMENEYQYYDRSKQAMKKIIHLHRKTGGTILLVGHAPSLEVLTRHLMNGQPRPERLAELSAKVDFCSMTIIERLAGTKSWQFRYSLDSQQVTNDWQRQQIEHSKSNHVRPAVVAQPSSNYQPPATFLDYLKKQVNAVQPTRHFPTQDEFAPFLTF